MQWLNLKTSTLHSPEYIGSEPRARAAWLNVMLWCAQQENGGRIERARDWKDRQWQQTCGVTRREVDSADRLLQWDSETLKVWNYPADKEHIVREKRDIGRAGGIKSGVARSTKAEQKDEAETKQTLEPTGQANASTERKGIGIGREEEDNTAPVPAAASSPTSEPSKSATKFDPSAVDLPENLNSARMRDAWTQWCIYRKERKQPMTAQTVKLQLAAMSKWGEPYTVSAIEKSIMNSWRGVFGPEDGAGNQSKTPAQKSEFASAF